MSDELEAFGDELQKISVMKNLPSLIKEDLTACIQRVIPRMQQTLPHGTTEYNMGACEAVRTIAQQNLMSTDNFTKVFLLHIINALESRDTVAADHWLNTLLDVIPVLPSPVLQTEIMPIAVNKAHISKPVQIRITSCRILGRLALHFHPLLVKKDVIPVVISLCQDVSGEVRAAMSTELPNLSTALGMETSNYLLNHVLDLVSDEELMVREAAIEAVAQMLTTFPAEILKTTIIPLTKKVFAEIVKNENYLLIVLSRFYGQYAIGLKNVMSVQEKTLFLQRYIQLSQLNSNNRRKLNPYKPAEIEDEELALRLTECRLNCAYNYPAMVLFTSDLKQDLLDSMFSVLHNLASDGFSQVRRRIAAGFFEVMKMMPKWHAALKAEFIRLLKDDIDIVLEGLVPNVSNIMLAFLGSNTVSADKAESGKEIGQALFVCEKNLSEATHWRLHEALLLTFRVVPKVFHTEFVYVYFVPLLMSRAVSGRILPCRVAALHTLLVILADPSQAKQKLKIRNRILELCNNSSFRCRLLFLRGMSILTTVSPEILKELFFHNITSMAGDKVANIRLMLCKMLPKLKELAMEPVDRKLLASLDAAVEILRNEKDRDVLALFKSAVKRMNDLESCKSPKSAIAQDSEGFELGETTKNSRLPNTITPLTNIRSFQNENMARATTSRYTIAHPSNIRGRISPSGHDIQGSRAQSLASITPSRAERTSPPNSRFSSQRPVAPHNRGVSERRKTITKLSPDDFMVDAGIPLKSTSVGKRIPTPRSVYSPLLSLNILEPDLKEPKRSVSSTLTSPRPSLTVLNKNLNTNNNRISNLPVKKTANLKPLSNVEIERELMDLDVLPHSPRLSERLKYPGIPAKTAKKENKRHSLDVANISSTYARMDARNSNTNRRYSLDVDSKKELGNKKNLSCINNNNLKSSKLGATRSPNVRPQSCVVQVEKVNHSKRSMSVENLPPKVTRLASRLPVRSTDPKSNKPK